MVIVLKERVSAKNIAHQELFNAMVPITWVARSLIVSRLRTDIIKKVALPVRVGKIIKELDYALPGPHTKIILTRCGPQIEGRGTVKDFCLL